MKRKIFLPAVIITLLLSAGACSSIDNDAKRVAELTCEAQQLMKKAASGDMSVLQRSQELALKADKLRVELEDKYKTAEEMEEFLRSLTRYLENCN
ncbi:MAG: hypothetical protein IT279_02225 [Ignavibacteriaceae bacterium]|nr:hypothetical protein [Ignavibacteriaceae bacterium]